MLQVVCFYLLLEQIIKDRVQIPLLQLYTGGVYLQSMYKSSLQCVVYCQIQLHTGGIHIQSMNNFTRVYCTMYMVRSSLILDLFISRCTRAFQSVLSVCLQIQLYWMCLSTHCAQYHSIFIPEIFVMRFFLSNELHRLFDLKTFWCFYY